MLSISVILLIAALVVLMLALRGRLVGDDPHCRACGFNLRGRDPASGKCPECGTELTARAMRTGQRVRRRGLLWAGLMLAVIAMGGVGLSSWMRVKNYDWSPWKPTKWLLEDIEGKGDYTLAVKELMRRLNDPTTPQHTIDEIVDRGLQHQADRGKSFDNTWIDLVEVAGKKQRLTTDRGNAYLTNAVTASLVARPKARRGQYLPWRYVHRIDRVTSLAEIRGPTASSGLMLDTAMIEPDFMGSKEDLFQGVKEEASGIYELKDWKISSLKDGPHVLKATLTDTLRQVKPFVAGPVAIKLELSAPVEVFPKDAVVDEFKADPTQRNAERAAVMGARVARDGGVMIKTATVPVSLSMVAFLKQGETEYRIGPLYVRAGSSPCWSGLQSFINRKLSGSVDVHLRPDQAPADPQPLLDTYWGEEIVIPGVIVDAPYAASFNRDESLRKLVEKSIVVRSVDRSADHELRGNILFDAPPVKLAYRAYFAYRGHEVEINPPDMPWITAAHQRYSWSLICPDPDTSHNAIDCDLILRPEPNWEKYSKDLEPPWGFEVVLHQLKIAPPVRVAPAAPSR